MTTATDKTGVGPPAESEDRELVEAVALAVCDAVRGPGKFDTLSDWAHERYRGDARVALDARAAHLARTATVAAVAPVPGPLVGDKYLVERAGSAIGTAIIHGHRQARDLALAALRAVDSHLATRALRPAREVAHEVMNERWPGCCEETNRESDYHAEICDSFTAAIERDRAGGRR